jgi:stringent starvation protein B
MSGADDGHDGEDATADDKVLRVDFTQGRQTAPTPPADPEAERKRAAFESLIDKGMVLLTLDTRVPGAQVPPQHEGDLQLGLNFSHRFYIEDFHWNDVEVQATLSFQGQPLLTVVPWASVWMMRSHVTGEAFVFPESAPPELADAIAELRDQMESGLAVASAEPEGATPAAPEAPDEPVDGAPDDDAGDDDDDGDDEPPRGGPRLRLVKS